LFEPTAGGVIDRCAITTVNIEEDGHLAVAPDLLLALWHARSSPTCQVMATAATGSRSS